MKKRLIKERVELLFKIKNSPTHPMRKVWELALMSIDNDLNKANQ